MSYSQQLIIDRTATRACVALLVNDEVCELKVEPLGEASVLGNIYRGKVIRVIEGMQAAFVDIGLEQPGFLHRRNVGTNTQNQNIEQLLHPGQSVIVQVMQAPRGLGENRKGAALSTDINIASRSLVYLPLDSSKRVIVSKSLREHAEADGIKSELEQLIESVDLSGAVIARGSAVVNRAELSAELSWLTERWQMALSNQQRAPQLLLPELGFTESFLRDNWPEQCSRIGVVYAQDLQPIAQFVEKFAPSKAAILQPLDDQETSIISATIAAAIESASAHSIALSNGGELVIDYTEAMTVVDVNTAAAVTGENIYHQTNLLAAKELARQLRLRSLGGIIIVDFIDCDPAEKQELVKTLQGYLSNDPAHTTLGAHSKLGLIEITRARRDPSLHEVLQYQCPSCDGRGRLKMAEA